MSAAPNIPDEHEVERTHAFAACRGRGERILVVDDCVDLCRLIDVWLRELGYEVRCVSSGALALSTLAQTAFDLVLLDLHMPEMGGLEVLAELRARWSRAELPVVVLTAHPGPELAVAAFEAGANDHLTKSADPVELATRLRVQLGVRREQQELHRARHWRLRPDSGGHLVRGGLDGADAGQGVCLRCTALLEARAPACDHCGDARPAAGWPTLDAAGVQWLGTTLAGRYRLVRRIGVGTTGVVFEARDFDLNRTYAVKMVDLERFDPLLQRHIYTEVKTLARLSNPHVVRLYEALRVDHGVIALVMDFAAGHTLGELLAYHGRVSPEQALEIVRQVAQALCEVHRLGLVHRDVKPDNIMVEELPGGRTFVRLLDFGIALPSLSEAREASFLGTPQYAAPEQNDPASSLDHRCDIYALGVLLYRLLAGHAPFEDPTFDAMMRAHLISPVPALPAGIAPDAVRAGLDALIADMMAKHRSLRPDDMVEVMRRIDALGVAPVSGLGLASVGGVRPVAESGRSVAQTWVVKKGG